MSGSVNKVILIGHLGADPEIKSHTRGGQYASLSLATGESWRDKNTGERKQKTEWHRVVIWNEALVKIAEQYLKKGSKVYIEGALETTKFQDRDGKDRYSTNIVLNGFRAVLTMLDKSESGRPEPSYPENDALTRSSVGGGNRAGDDMNDDIPF